MDVVSLYQDKNINVIQSKESVSLIVHGFIKGECLRKALTCTIDAANQKNFNTLLINFNELEVVKQEDIEWVVHVWIPFVRAGKARAPQCPGF